ncbi:MAG TPA: hypothetical protein VMH89_12690, partial [Candidatus Acidoferrum sp.]|nr:hypothetical protein [Candidatus Acidoferrum sp.]
GPETPGGRFLVLGGASLAFAGVTLIMARNLWMKLSIDQERMVLLFYPMRDVDFYRWATMRFGAGTAWVVIVAAIAYFLAVPVNGPSDVAILIVAAIAEWLVVLCVMLALVRHVDKYPRWLSLVFFVAVALLFIAPGQYLGSLIPLAWVLPTGWVNGLLSGKIAARWVSLAVVALLPVLGLLCWWLWKQLETFYVQAQEATVAVAMATSEAMMTELLTSKSSGRTWIEMPTDESADLEEELNSEAAFPLQAAWRKQRLENLNIQVGKYVLEENWLERWNWKNLGPLEWIASWFLTEKEKGIAQFLIGTRPPGWTGRLRIAVIATAVAFAAVLPEMNALNFIAGLAFATSIGAGLPLLGGTWPAGNQGRISGKLSPIFGCYPVSYWTGGWTIYKLNVVRMLAWLPLGLMLGVLGARSAHQPLMYGFWLTTRGLLCLVAVMPLLAMSKFAKVTNDTSYLRIKSIFILILVLSLVFAVITLIGMAMMLPVEMASMSIVAIMILGWLGWSIYGVYYDRGKVDLLRDRP